MSSFTFGESLCIFSQFETVTNSVLIKLIGASRLTLDAKTFVSSANSINCNNSDDLTMSSTYINNNGPRIDPCGTPHLISDGVEI